MLETMEGYYNWDKGELNRKGIYIERLIDKIAYDDSDDKILEIEEGV